MDKALLLGTVCAKSRVLAIGWDTCNRCFHFFRKGPSRQLCASEKSSYAKSMPVKLADCLRS